MGAIQCTNEKETTHIEVWKNNWGTQSKAVLKICKGIWCSSFYAKEFDIIFMKIISLHYPIIFLHSVPHITSKPGGWGGN